MKKHFVKFYSPGTFVHEITIKEIESWDKDVAKKMATSIKERYGAVPFGFSFFTKERTEKDLDSKIVKESGMFFLGGKVLTLKDIKTRNDPKDKILISNMECNGWSKVIENTNSWKVVQPLNKDDVVLYD